MGRMACAYIVDVAGAKRALDDLTINKCTEMVDWWHNVLIKTKVIKLYWLHPAIVEQGSHNGKLNGTISSRGRNHKRYLAWQTQKFYKYYIARLFKQRRIIED